MLTLMPGCALSKSGTSFFRSVIEGLSTDPSVTVLVPPPPPPPPAPEQADATRARTRPRTVMATRLRSGERCLLSPMHSHLFLVAPPPQAPTRRLTTLSKDTVVVFSTDHSKP